MAQIIIEVPDEKVYLVVDAVKDKLNNPDMTNQEVLQYVKDYLRAHLQGIVKVYQQKVLMVTFTFDDPTLP